jgi:hypothetical protein
MLTTAGERAVVLPKSKRRFVMIEDQAYGRASEQEQKPKTEESPSEKLEEEKPTGSLVPGAENPESKEIKEEKSLNTE